MFLAFDGDKIGNKLESLLIDNNVLKIKEFTDEVWGTLHFIEEQLRNNGCNIIFASGDSVFAESTENIDFKKIKRDFGNITFSLGVGNTPLEAMLALKKAKSKGVAGFCLYKMKR